MVVKNMQRRMVPTRAIATAAAPGEGVKSFDEQVDEVVQRFRGAAVTPQRFLELENALHAAAMAVCRSVVEQEVNRLEADDKRLHTFEEMRHGTEGWLSATSENMSLHMDMNARRVAAFPPDIQPRIAGIAKTHSTLARPEGIGRSVAMPSKR